MAGGHEMEYGLIGKTLKHSFSKPIHENMCDYKYVLQELPSAILFENFMRHAEFKAINVTIPYKQDVIPYCAHIDKHAKTIGAVNTIVNKDGVLHGYNTDYAGFLYMANSAGVKFEGKNVMVLGTGGTQQTVLAVAKDEKASKIYIVGRKAKGHLSKDNVVFIDYDDAKKLKDIEIIINTTPVGMFPKNNATPLNLLKKTEDGNYIYNKLQAVLDVIYNPRRTVLLQQAQKRNLIVADGLSMLVAQAKYAAEIFINADIDDEKISETEKFMRAKAANIIFIGMPGSGKSHVGKLVSLAINRNFIDLDALCIERAKMSIAEYFEKHGEQGFRDLESEVCAEAAKQSGAIISTGGGTILRQENVEALKQNGVLIYIDRPLENLQKGKGRPLSTNEDAIKVLYEQRAPIYSKIADITIKNDVSAQKAADDAREAFNEFINNKWA